MSQGSLIINVILLAGGSGSRMKGATDDKILLPLKGKPAFQYSLEAFKASGVVSHMIIVYRDAEQKEILEALVHENGPKVSWTQGGAERHNSVFNGLEKCSRDTEIVLIHDCARPLITPSAIQKVAAFAQQLGCACVAKKVNDTIKEVSPSDTDNSTFQLKTLDRSKLWAMETPQAFQYKLIHDAYTDVIAKGSHITDDLSAMESLGVPTKLIENERPNQKLTSPEDIQYLEFLLQNDFK